MTGPASLAVTAGKKTGPSATMEAPALTHGLLCLPLTIHRISVQAGMVIFRVGKLNFELRNSYFESGNL